MQTDIALVGFPCTRADGRFHHSKPVSEILFYGLLVSHNQCTIVTVARCCGQSAGSLLPCLGINALPFPIVQGDPSLPESIRAFGNTSFVVAAALRHFIPPT